MGKIKKENEIEPKPNIITTRVISVSEEEEQAPPPPPSKVETKEYSNINSGLQDDIETYVGISPGVIIDEFEPVPPPNDMHTRSDQEVIAWLKENDYKDLDDKDVEISRTAEYLIISISSEDATDTIRCKIRD
ncbi:hypothetical protein [Desertivirga arenae]|uniref:hypothetical protein n=1 Tax=Desertivirga arenae TaxID=2810309 RepID=UPI001A9581A5|nr:hypothetical protein [Pedobacter sp. SYSU D00823]